MGKYAKSKKFRRKQERVQVSAVLINHAVSLGLRLVGMKNVYPRNVEDAIVAIEQARLELPLDSDKAVHMLHPDLPIELLLVNLETPE